VRVVKEKDGRIVRRVGLVDEAGEVSGPPTRFLGHLMDGGYSPHTVCAYGYDLCYLFKFLDSELLDWRAFDPPAAMRFLGFLRRLPSQRPAQRMGLAVATAGGRLLAPATVQRILAATSSFYEWAISAAEYDGDDNPMQCRPDLALARVPGRHQPFVGRASRQQPVRRTVRVRVPMRLPRPMTSGEIEVLLKSMTSLRDLAIILLMLDGGLRPGEVLGLHLDDVS
jgi:integrase/recombinase XerD